MDEIDQSQQPEQMQKRSNLIKTIVFVGMAILALSGTIFGAYAYIQYIQPAPTTFKECAQLNDSAIQESHPRVCVARDGTKFVEPIESTISWNEAVEHIRNCDVETVAQLHNLEVTLMLKDGTSAKTTEPAIDDVFEVVEQSQPTCGEIMMITE